jgi:hypothetical protein
MTGGEVVLSTIVDEKVASEAAGRLVRLITSDYPRKKFSEIAFLMQKGLPQYIRAQSFRCERIKTLLNRNEPVLLQETYVQPYFHFRKRQTTTLQFLDTVVRECRSVIITGLAGSGKSAFMKYAFLHAIERGDTFYPIFFELRRLNSYGKSKNILKRAIFESVHELCPSFTEHVLEFGLRRGAFYLFLDGFDELNPEIRDDVADQIERLASVSQETCVLVTSRPADDLESWNAFDYAELQPFDLEQAAEYVSKLKYDAEQKEAFLAELTEGLFEEHRTFLSNPLLTAMMLFTYSSQGEIPTKRYAFYRKCFDVLALEHDALKGRYQREFFSGLSLDEIASVFMYFCTLSYRKQKYRFRDDEALAFIEKGMAAASVSGDKKQVLRDLAESICILIRDGIEYEFIHRSFQEYFYAKFVVEDRKISLEDKVLWLVERVSRDDAIAMIAEMDVEYFEDEFLIPRVRSMVKALDGVDASKRPSLVLGKIYDLVSVRHNDSDGGEWSMYMQIRNLVSHFVSMQPFSSTYRADFPSSEFSMWPKDQSELAERIFTNYGGEVKFHHANDEKLVSLGFGKVAEDRKACLQRFWEFLEARQNGRKDVMMEAFTKEYLA